MSAEGFISKIPKGVKLFHTPDGTAYASVKIDGHKETWPIRSRQFRSHLKWKASTGTKAERKRLTDQALKNLVDILEYRAKTEFLESSVYLRVAGRRQKLYLDLADKDRRVVEITEAGWRIIKTPPVNFIRPEGMLALPGPIDDGTGIKQLKQLINVRGPDFKLLISWAIAALRPTGPYPMLNFTGGQGSAKSFAAKLLKQLIDPAKAPARTLPRSERDLMISAGNSLILAFDNVSKISLPMSDALCRVATGGGLSTRKLYLDSEEVFFEACRPVIINGIGDIITRNDLADRALIITLPTIKKEDRIPERILWPQFEEARPMILGTLLTGVSAAIKNVDTVNLETYPRMADFLEWAVAATPAFGWGEKAIIRAYEKNTKTASQACFEADVVALATYDLMQERQALRETPADLLQMLAERKPEAARDKYWPKAPNQLSNRLKEAAPALMEKGIDVQFKRPGGVRTIILRRAEADDDL
jgi:hypothetical protein